MLKRIGRSARTQALLGRALAGYIRLVRRTTRWARDPEDLHAGVRRDRPVIVAMWHGQHLLVPLLRPDWLPSRSLVSRHADGGANAVALERLGIGVVRGSAGGSTAKVARRGGISAARELLRALRGGESVVLTADLPKVSGVAGSGIVMLAKHSGRPIYPVAAVTGRSIELGSWDRAAVPLPFGRGALVVGDPIAVPADADARAVEAARVALEGALDRAHARAYRLAGGPAWRRGDG